MFKKNFIINLFLIFFFQINVILADAFDSKIDEIRAEIIRDLNDDWNKAINDPFPKDNDLLKNVYY